MLTVFDVIGILFVASMLLAALKLSLRNRPEEGVVEEENL